MPEIRDNKISCSNYQCEIEVTLEILAGKWKSLILWNLHLQQKIRYNELRRVVQGITQKMLTQQLRELEKYGIVQRQVFNTVPPMVEYSLTKAGEDLIPIMQQMDDWGKKYVQIYQNLQPNKKD